ncbi:YlcI/YnfO family protein [Falsiroseomonas sp. HC035]|uniref:YlcI/YnfO family protein n=1 Tax=Falsiroseomonas sp. HC035 TaxID=3390999 RepID=UPI003D311B2D
MATYGNYALRLPASLMADLRAAAERDGVSMNGFIVQAVAEKVAALRARGFLGDLTPEEQAVYLDGRAARSREGRLSKLIAKAGTTDEVLPGDELPAGWLPDSEPGDDVAADSGPRQRV